MTRVSVKENRQGRGSEVRIPEPNEACGRVGVHNQRPSALALLGKITPPDRISDRLHRDEERK